MQGWLTNIGKSNLRKYLWSNVAKPDSPDYYMSQQKNHTNNADFMAPMVITVFYHPASHGPKPLDPVT